MPKTPKLTAEDFAKKELNGNIAKAKDLLAKYVIYPRKPKVATPAAPATPPAKPPMPAPQPNGAPKEEEPSDNSEE